jgi:hypothetical protein
MHPELGGLNAVYRLSAANNTALVYRRVSFAVNGVAA